MKPLLISIGILVSFMLLTSVVLPMLISTDQLPLPVILLMISVLAFLIGAIFLIALNHFTKSEKDYEPRV